MSFVKVEGEYARENPENGVQSTIEYEFLLSLKENEHTYRVSKYCGMFYLRNTERSDQCTGNYLSPETGTFFVRQFTCLQRPWTVRYAQFMVSFAFSGYVDDV